jgi:DNA-binding LytR/AlgR family response regulator
MQIEPFGAYIRSEAARTVNVFVVEHNDSARQDLCDELSRLSFVKNVATAASEQAAEAILSGFTPDVVMLDMQLPKSAAFRIADRSWSGSMPIIVCITTFERRLVEVFSRHRVEYLVRPFGADDLHYAMTRGRRPDPIDPALNLKRLLDAAIALGQPVRGRISTWRQGKSFIVEANQITAIRYAGGRFYLWTPGGIHETAGPAAEIENAIGSSSFRRLYPNALISADRDRFGSDLRRARVWLERCHFSDVFLRRLPAHAKGGRADGLFTARPGMTSR